MLLRYFLHGWFFYLFALSVTTIRQPYQRTLSLHIRNISCLIRDVFFYCEETRFEKSRLKLSKLSLSKYNYISFYAIIATYLIK